MPDMNSSNGARCGMSRRAPRPSDYPMPAGHLLSARQTVSFRGSGCLGNPSQPKISYPLAITAGRGVSVLDRRLAHHGLLARGPPGFAARSC